jgi:hypothetical protein
LEDSLQKNKENKEWKEREKEKRRVHQTRRWSRNDV